jgi:hypothetical protein
MAMEIDYPKPEDLFCAAEKGDASLFQNLPEDSLARARSLRNEDGRSLLHVASSFGHSPVSSLVLTRILPSFLFFFPSLLRSLEVCIHTLQFLKFKIYFSSFNVLTVFFKIKLQLPYWRRVIKTIDYRKSYY